MPRDSAAADRPASYLVGTAAAFPLFFRDRTKPINQLPFSPSAKFPKSGSSGESRAKGEIQIGGPYEGESTDAGHRGGATRSVCLTADVSGGLKSHSARGPGLISKDGGNASSAEDDGKVWRG